MSSIIEGALIRSKIEKNCPHHTASQFRAHSFNSCVDVQHQFVYVLLATLVTGKRNELLEVLTIIICLNWELELDEISQCRQCNTRFISKSSFPASNIRFASSHNGFCYCLFDTQI
uniref:Uncharacterized protein n=1 Tax=Cacopsylla melanoneura TaxID=428564 RepID=A0A8D8PPT5_9HEMI